MNRFAKITFFILTGFAMAAAVEPFAMYTMTTIHVSSIERILVASTCVAVVAFTIGVWRRHRWMLSPVIASNILFGTWYLYALWGTFQSHNYTTLSCLILPLLFAISPFLAAVALVAWGGKYSEESAQQVVPPNGP